VRHFSLMLVPDSGPVRSYHIQKSWLISFTLFFVLLTSLGVWGVYSAYQTEQLTVALEKAQQNLRLVRSQQKNDHLNMQAQLDAEHEKIAVYTRTLGDLKARMARLDAFGKHLVQVSKMKDSTFDFDVPPAMGGPRIYGEVLGTQDLGQRMVSMNAQLSHLDAQLVAIDVLLQGDREEKVAKPHAWPSEDGWLSSHFGMRDDPFTGAPALHKGVDIANRFGAPVLAASRGVVVFSGKMKGYGYLIEIEHGYGYRTRYAHMSASLVKAGDLVKDAQLIGRVGSVGRSTGPHLHFEVLHFGHQIDPEPFLPHV